ncbi:translational GTPase TypA [Fusobacterium perfoetens]|uniref:translational GTPase TypA n=1 Tax=Fusobacterium perfoetens TaxID=852 RepID=UPI0015A3D2D1|nr:translational GTPase TypA [Fusobacterium perfoetens]MCF2624625.1 translational GTPase TypA [Fusobacterium perfoetens]
MKIKNIAIIAHVDHGKTTLVDCLLRQAGVFGAHELEKVSDRVMDSNDIERERGITIFSKNASVKYKDYKINIVDTPGHADFGGEVQRIMKMVDSVILLVDAFEGPMPQTKYVLKKALEQGHRPIVVVNKVDRPNARPEEVLYMVYDLFLELNANEHQLEFPVLYASGKGGFAKKELDDPSENMVPLFETILSEVDDPEGDENKPLQFLITNIEYDNYVGQLAVGKIHNGKIRKNQEVMLIKRDGKMIKGKVSLLYGYEGLNRVEIPEATTGEIISIAGLSGLDIGETIADVNDPQALPLISIDEPTLAMTFMVNNSPFAGKDGKYITSRNIWDRLQKELQKNVSMRVEATDSPDAFTVKGRGELQLSILLENMRREGYEVQVSKPRVIFKEIDGKTYEPVEIAVVDVDETFAGVVIEKLGGRKGELISMTPGQDGYTRLEFKIPSRGIIGYRNEFLTDTKGSGILNHSFYDFEPFKGPISGRKKGVLIATETGVSVAYALNALQDRGEMFIDPGVNVYEGMVVGEHSKENDLVVNVCKTKKLTNTRAAGSDDAVKLAPPRKLTLEQALDYISEDEYVEVTPNFIRLRKKYLTDNERRRHFNKN